MLKKIALYVGFFIGTIFVCAALYYTYVRLAVESRSALEAAPVTTLFVDVGTEKIAYRMIDNHALTTVVFVGGLSGWSGTWERSIQAADAKNKNYNYLSLDLPPFGYSVVDPEKGYFRAVQADRIEGLVKGLGLKNVVMVAHSYGAGPTAEYALRKPVEVRRLVIIDGVLNVDEPKIVPDGGIVQVDAIRNPLIGILAHSTIFVRSRFKEFVSIKDNVTRELMDVYMRSFDTKGTTVRLSNWFKDYVNDPLAYDSTASENYKKLSIPVRLIWGEEDTVTPLELTRVLMGSIPDVRLHSLPGIGHIPMIEDYGVFDSALLEALSR